MSPVEETAVRTLKRQYPHVDTIEDWRAQQSVRLLWDRIFDLEERLAASQATIKTLVDGQNATEAKLQVVDRHANEALAVTQDPEKTTAEGGGEDEELPGGGDGGAGAEGCATAGADGHDGGGTLSAERAGQIVCGTGAEFPALLVATATIEERDDNAEELMLRAVWHLRQAGFEAGRQQNPSGLLSRDKLTVIVDGVTRAYDIFQGKGDFATPMTTQMLEVAPPVMVDDPGTPD